MQEIKFDCIHCGGHLKVDASSEGQSALCPLCKKTILIPFIKLASPIAMESSKQNEIVAQGDDSVEHADATKVDEAHKLMRQGHNSEAENILLGVCSRCPDDYQYTYVVGNVRYIKFWDVNEFIHYAGIHKDEIKETIIWIKSAYPRACYFLAYLLIENHKYQEALRGWPRDNRWNKATRSFLLSSGLRIVI